MTNPAPRPRELLTLFYRLHRRKHNATLNALSAAGLQEVGSPRILFLLLDAEGGEALSQQEIAVQMHLSPATVTTALASLERLGYVERREDAEDRRKKRIALTEKGRDACRRCIEVFERVDDQFCAGFTPEELERLTVQFQRMLDNLEVLDPGDGPVRKDDSL